MKFSVFTASTPEWTPEEVVAQLSAQGWDGVEWRVIDQKPAEGSGFWAGNKATWPASTFPEDAPRIKELTEKAGLGISGIGAYVTCDQLEEVERLMQGAAAVGATKMRVGAGKPAPGESYRDKFERSRAQYRDVAQLAARYGVRAMVEMHHQQLTASASACARFFEGFDPQHVGVIHDIGNMLHEGYEYLPWSLEILGDYLAHVHVKNAVPEVVAETPEQTTWKWTWAPLRKGVGDFRQLFDALAAVGYDDWVAVEDFSTEQPLAERTAANLAYLRELAG